MNTNFSISLDNSLANLLYAKAEESGMQVEKYLIHIISKEVKEAHTPTVKQTLRERLKQMTTGKVYGADMPDDYKQTMRKFGAR